MGLVKALFITTVLVAIMYVLRTRYIDTLACETRVTLLTWIPFVLIFFYFLL